MFENMTNEQVKAVIDTWEKVPSNEVARQALYQVFVVNETPLSYDEKKVVCIYNPSINGMGCAAGMLVRENLKDRLIENKRISTIIAHDDVMAEYFSATRDDYVECVQNMHDGCCGRTYGSPIESFYNFLQG